MTRRPSVGRWLARGMLVGLLLVVGAGATSPGAGPGRPNGLTPAAARDGDEPGATWPAAVAWKVPTPPAGQAALASPTHTEHATAPPLPPAQAAVTSPDPAADEDTVLVAAVALSIATPTVAPSRAPLPARTPTPPSAQSAPSPAATTAGPIPTSAPANRPLPPGRPIPILMYHYIRVVDQRQDRLGFGLSVAPARFAEQMDWLATNGYTTVTMRDLAACLRGDRDCPPRTVVLTFDDGYADNWSEALPVLTRHGFTATFYIVSGFVERPGYMTWAQLADLRDAGMEIGAHTVSHRDLTAAAPAAAREEIVRSRQVLSERLGVPITTFAYPAGRFSPATAELVRQAGYETAVTTQPGRLPGRLLELPRLRVLGGSSPAEFATLVAGRG